MFQRATIMSNRPTRVYSARTIGRTRRRFKFQVSPSSTSSTIPLKVAIPTGFMAGTMGSLCGIGGGAVIIPSLSSFTAMSPHAVSASSLFCVSIASATGAASYLEQGYTNLPLALTLMATSVPASALGARLVTFLPGAALKKLSGAVMLMSAPILYQQSSKPTPNEEEDERINTKLRALKKKNRFTWEEVKSLQATDILSFMEHHLDFVLLGAVTGFASGIIGIGGGLVMNTYMALHRPEMLQHEIVATSLLVAVPIGISGSYVHFRSGRIRLAGCGMLAISTAVSMGATSRFLKDVDDQPLKQLFALTLAASSLAMMR